MFTWEEDFLTDDMMRYCADGVEVGRIERFGGSWKVIHGGEFIASRPDKETAQRALAAYDATQRKGGAQ